MYVGTDRSMIPYYEKFGFRPDYVEPNFFVDNYENPIVVDGVRLRDMHYLSMELGGRQGGKAI
jgi:hypothetical protein